MATLVEMALEMVIARAKSTPLTAEDMLQELKKFHVELKKLDTGVVAETEESQQETQLAASLTQKEAFKRNEVCCMICGKGGFKILTSHLRVAHDLKPRQYKEMFGIARKQSLTAKTYSDSRSKKAIESGMSERLRARKEAVKTAKDSRQAKTAGKVKSSAGKASAQAAPTGAAATVSPIPKRKRGRPSLSVVLPTGE
ncbi:MAG TPA: MucR family transcriptional regulator [Geomonas sp.]|nr:MucR family transcriptional regulator [Geomonas sp.]